MEMEPSPLVTSFHALSQWAAGKCHVDAMPVSLLWAPRWIRCSTGVRGEANIMGRVGIQHDDGFEGTTLGVTHERLHGGCQRASFNGRQNAVVPIEPSGIHATGRGLHGRIGIGSSDNQGMLARR